VRLEVADGAENLDLKALQFQNVGVCRRYSGGARVNSIDLVIALLSVSLMLAFNRSVLNRE
jgi:hypothetical protein